MNPTIPQSAIDLILESEGIDQPGHWPGGESGITLGYGVDIGADPASLEFWRGVLTDLQIERLSAAKGLTGPRAQSIAPHFRDITVTRQQALDVFLNKTLPREIATTVAAFPNADKLPPPALGALVSLVYNRGASLAGDRRAEMKSIHDALINWQANDEGEDPQERLNNLLKFMAEEFRSMKRLWEGKGVDGLIARREREARLIESAIT